MEDRNKNFIISGVLLMFIILGTFYLVFRPETIDTEVKEENKMALSTVLGSTEQSFVPISIEELEGYGDRTYIIIDVRNFDEFRQARLKRAVNLDLDRNFRDEINKFPKENTYILYSNEEVRSNNAMNIMSELGFQNVYIIEGGLNAWKDNNYPTLND